MFLLDCSSYSTLSVVYVIKSIINIVCVLVPVVLTILIIKKIATTVISGDDFDQKVVKSILIRAFGAALIVLFPSLLGGINFIINGTSSTDGFCWSQATSSNVSLAKKNYLNNRKENSEYDTFKKEREEEKKKREEELKEKENKEKDKVNAIDPSLNVGESGSSGSNAIQSGSNSKLLQGAVKAQTYTQENGYLYGHAHSFDGKDYYGNSDIGTLGKVVSCDRGVALAMYYGGFIDDGTDISKLTLFVLKSYLIRKGATYIANFGDLQPGDIVFCNIHGEGIDHVLIWDTPTHKYDWGSTDHIQRPSEINSGPVVANSASAYWAGAYRLPNQ